MIAPARAGAPAFTPATLYTFVVLGIPDGLLGVAWPQMRLEQHEAASRLSVLIVCGTVTFFASSLVSGWAATRWPVRRLLLGAALAGATGGVVVGTSQNLSLAALGVALLSGGGGMLDPVLNGIAALSAGRSLIPLMHGLYAVGAAGAPALIAAWSGSSAWRVAYIGVAATYTVALSIWIFVGRGASTLSAAATKADPTSDDPELPAVSELAAGSGRPAGVIATLAAFVALSGLEIGAASWAAIFLTDSLGRSTSTAGAGLLGFWIALSGARIIAGATDSAHRGPRTWLRASCGAALIGSALMWAASTAPVAMIGLALLGAGVGPLLPLLTALTPERVGRAIATRMIGWQLAAASLGSALISGGIGLWVHHSGVRAVAPALTLTALVTAVLVTALERPIQPRRRVGGTAPTSSAAARGDQPSDLRLVEDDLGGR